MEALPLDALVDPAVEFEDETAGEKCIRLTDSVKFVLTRRESVEPVEDSVWTRLSKSWSVQWVVCAILLL